MRTVSKSEHIRVLVLVSGYFRIGILYENSDKIRSPSIIRIGLGYFRIGILSENSA